MFLYWKYGTTGRRTEEGGGEGGEIEPPFSEIFIFSLTAFAMFRKETGIFFKSRSRQVWSEKEGDLAVRNTQAGSDGAVYGDLVGRCCGFAHDHNHHN